MTSRMEIALNAIETARAALAEDVGSLLVSGAPDDLAVARRRLEVIQALSLAERELRASREPGGQIESRNPAPRQRSNKSQGVALPGETPKSAASKHEYRISGDELQRFTKSAKSGSTYMQAITRPELERVWAAIRATDGRFPMEVIEKSIGDTPRYKAYMLLTIAQDQGLVSNPARGLYTLTADGRNKTADEIWVSLEARYGDQGGAT